MKYNELVLAFTLSVKMFFVGSITLIQAENYNYSTAIENEEIIESNISNIFGSNEKIFTKLWDELEEVTLPLDTSFSFLLDLPGFKSIPKMLENSFIDDYALDNYMIAKLPNKKNIKLFVLAVSEMSGEKILFLGSLTDNINLLEIYSVMDYDLDGGIGSLGKTYKISSIYEIIISTYFSPFDSKYSTLIKKEIYSINSNGEFIPVQGK